MPNRSSSLPRLLGRSTALAAAAALPLLALPTSALAAHDKQAGFKLAHTPHVVSLTQGRNAQVKIRTASVGRKATTVSFHLTGLPTDAIAHFRPSSVVAGRSTTLAISTQRATHAGRYHVHLAVEGGSAHLATIARVHRPHARARKTATTRTAMITVAVAVAKRGASTSAAAPPAAATASAPAAAAISSSVSLGNNSVQVLSSAVFSGHLIVGLNANTAGWGNSAGPRLKSVVQNSGATWLREDFYWSRIETSKGTYNWTASDSYMKTVAQQGNVHILAILYDTPSWAGPNAAGMPTDPSTYAQFVAAFVARYGQGGTFWAQNPTLNAAAAIQDYEFYNEPYYNTGSAYDPGAYAQTVKAAYAAAKPLDPSATFLMAAAMQSAQNSTGAWSWWVDDLYKAVPDLNNYYDAVAVHPYGTDVNDLPFINPGQAYSHYQDTERILDIRQQFITHNATAKPFWITEIGWSTCTDGETKCVTTAQQASNYQTFFNDVNTEWSGFVQAVFAYNYQNNNSTGTDSEANYGLITNTDGTNGTPKPALAIFKNEEAYANNL